MKFFKTYLLVWQIGLALMVADVSWAQDSLPKPAASQVRVMSWNIWRGGREDDQTVGPQRVVEVIRQSQADVVAMQETYGSGETISQALGFHYQTRGTNLSIHSRFPIVEDISVFEEFKCVGSLIELPNNQRIAFYCLWLPYAEDIWIPETRRKATDAEMQAACQPSADDLKKILAAIEHRLADEKYGDVSIVIAGDFNSMSHLDWTTTASDQFDRVIAWPTSRLMTSAGFRDSYREANPKIDRMRDSTWSPRFPEQEQDRIDYIYYRSDTLRTKDSRVIREHTERFPSDHGALITTLEHVKPQVAEIQQSLSTVSYNIRRGLGIDNKTDLNRTAATLAKLNADIIGLQEVDMLVARSGRVNQAAELGDKLEMHAAFGPFMNHDGGRYGMAVLSRYPIQDIQEIALPLGNEPRIALAVEVLLPDNNRVLVVNVHFDWVDDDTFRFAQAQHLANFLQQQEIPYVLLGDFNDQPDSRTLQLFRKIAIEATKPTGQSNTWPADHPKKEIDFIFAAPAHLWQVPTASVISEALASDHRPVQAMLELKPSATSDTE